MEVETDWQDFGQKLSTILSNHDHHTHPRRHPTHCRKQGALPALQSPATHRGFGAKMDESKRGFDAAQMQVRVLDAHYL